jgi:hypothetical protein
LVLGEEYEIGAIRTRRHRDGAVRLGCDVAIDHAREMRGVLGRLRRNDQHLLETFRAIGVLHQFGNPHRFARLVLAGEDAQPPGASAIGH